MQSPSCQLLLLQSRINLVDSRVLWCRGDAALTAGAAANLKQERPRHGVVAIPRNPCGPSGPAVAGGRCPNSRGGTAAQRRGSAAATTTSSCSPPSPSSPTPTCATLTTTITSMLRGTSARRQDPLEVEGEVSSLSPRRGGGCISLRRFI